LGHSVSFDSSSCMPAHVGAHSTTDSQAALGGGTVAA